MTLARPAALACLVAAALSLTACGPVERGRPDAATMPSGADPTVAEGVAEGTGATTSADRQEATAQAAPAWHETRSEAGDRVADAAITASVNAELARDDDLSALRIDVDTTNGHVLLKGSAPSPTARERAARIASSVRGVTSVDNQLVVQR